MTKSSAQLDRGGPEVASRTPGPPEVPRGAATRRRILDAASTLVAERGWGAVSTRLVAQRAGVNPALVHYHFGSKEALLRRAVVETIEAEIAAAVQPLLAADRLTEGLDAAFSAIDRFDPASPSGVLLAEAMLRATRDPAVRATMATELAGFRRELAQRLRSAIAAGEVRSDLDPDATACALAALLDGLLLHRLADPAVELGGLGHTIGALMAPPATTDPADGRIR
jgi:AcrR family transcriptional regulator